MEFLSVVMIAIGLSFDSFAVSVTSGLVMKNITFRKATRIAFFLAFFQGGLPVLGWFLGYEIRDYVEAYDHWIAFGLLSVLGIRMILGGISNDPTKPQLNPLKLNVLIGMSIATSIDAFIVGISFALIQLPILYPVLIIAIITFIFSMLGILFGKKTGAKFGNRMEIIGGLILLGIGIKILFEHIYGDWQFALTFFN